jgi:outer membrane protein assembly factor BamB
VSTSDEPVVGVVGELPAGPWRLADSPWPRTAGDRRNSRHVEVEGPRRGRLRRVFECAGEGGRGGLAVAADCSLRMTLEGRLWAFDSDGGLLWKLEPFEAASGMSSPLLLADGTCIVTAGRELLFVSASGVELARVDTGLRLDDSGPALNLAPDGTLILTTMYGELFGLRGSELELLGSGLGYDLVPPAIDDDGSMVLAGYAGKGLVRVDPRGAIVWRSDLRYADLLPTIDREGRAAGGSLNERESRILARDGRLLGSWPAAATFAAADEGWVALSEDALAGLGHEGELRWQRNGGARGRWGSLGPAIDRLGRVHAPCSAALVVLESDGRERFVVPLPGAPSDLALVGDGRVALVLGDGLYFVE